MAKAVSMTIGVPGVEVWINYNDGNKRIQTVDWELLAGVVMRVRIWDTDQSATFPIYDRSQGGPSSGSESVPGNNRMVTHPDGYDELPSNIKYSIQVETIGI